MIDVVCDLVVDLDHPFDPLSADAFRKDGRAIRSVEDLHAAAARDRAGATEAHPLRLWLPRAQGKTNRLVD